MSNFNFYFPKLQINEGGFSDSPNDWGKITYMGITRKYYPDWQGWAIIDQHDLKHGDMLPELEPLVKSFYEVNYWNKLHCDLIDSQKIAEMLCDWNITSGKPAVKALQRIVGVADDGIVGGGTVAAVNMANECELCDRFISARKEFYTNIVANDKTQEMFLRGWFERVDRLA